MSNGLDTKTVEAYNLDTNTGVWRKLADMYQAGTSYGSSGNSIPSFNARKMYLFGGSSSINRTHGDRATWYYWRFETETFYPYSVTDTIRVNIEVTLNSR